MRSRRTPRPVAALGVASLLFALSGCEATGGDPVGTGTGPAAGSEGAAPPAGDQPVPVEADGGMGGEGGGPVTSNLILSSDAGGADRVEVTATCLVAEEPPTYRLDLAGGGTLTVATGDEGGRLALAFDGATYRSPDGQPPIATASTGALSVQGRAVAGDGEERFVDAVIGLDDLPAC